MKKPYVRHCVRNRSRDPRRRRSDPQTLQAAEDPINPLGSMFKACIVGHQRAHPKRRAQGDRRRTRGCRVGKYMRDGRSTRGRVTRSRAPPPLRWRDCRRTVQRRRPRARRRRRVLAEHEAEDANQTVAILVGEVSREFDLHTLHERREAGMLGDTGGAQADNVAPRVSGVPAPFDQAASFHPRDEVGDRGAIEVDFVAQLLLAGLGESVEDGEDRVLNARGLGGDQRRPQRDVPLLCAT